MSYIVRNLHFIVIHVPIAMLLFSFIFDLLAVILKKKGWHAAGLLCLVTGTLGAIAAVLTGPEEERNPLFPTHELYGKITMAFFIVLTCVRLWLELRKKLEIGRNAIYLTAALIGVILVSYTGHLGGKMVHPDRRPPSGQFGENRPRQQTDQGGRQFQNGPQQQQQQQAPDRSGSQ